MRRTRRWAGAGAAASAAGFCILPASVRRSQAASSLGLCRALAAQCAVQAVGVWVLLRGACAGQAPGPLAAHLGSPAQALTASTPGALRSCCRARRLCAVMLDCLGRDMMVRREYGVDENGWPGIFQRLTISAGQQVRARGLWEGSRGAAREARGVGVGRRLWWGAGVARV